MNKEQDTEIQEYLDMFVKNHAGEKFTFRPGQKEAIIDIVKTYLGEQKKMYLLSAPTGSGKSIIGIAAAFILNKFGKRGYILTSELTLQDQYENDIRRLKLGWGSVKGVDNYECTENGEKHSLGDCKIKNMNSSAIKQLPCYRECPYFFARDYASFTPTAILNYSLYLIHMNYVLPRVEHPPFDERDFIICDEAHKVLEIVQKHFSPVVDEMTYVNLNKLRTFLANKSMAVPYNGVEIKTIINKIFAEEDNEKLFILNRQFEKILGAFVNHTDEIKKFVGRKYSGKSVPAEWRAGLRLCDWVKDVHCKFEDYNHIIAKTDIRAMVKNQSGDKIQFNCINEKYLMKKHYHDLNNFNIMMTATMGDPKTFLHSIKGNNAKYRRIPSNFNFDKSPIYVYMSKSMSFKNKETTFPWMIEKIQEILDKHKGENGIIHTGSYANSQRIMKDLEDNSRLLIYSDSADKKELLFDFNGVGNKVLMGPSLLEGLDLSEEKSRFQIFAKVPYQSLADRYVKTKMKVDPSWYSWKAVMAILQGVGRSVRSKDDHAVTYILDGDFMALWRRNATQFPDEFNDRLIFIR